MSLAVAAASAVNPIAGMMERISPGLSEKMAVEIRPDTVEYFQLTQRPAGPHIEASGAVSAATGLNWYLKHVAGQPLTWDNMTATLPATLPAVADTVRRTAAVPHRYYLNYCTHSYSMAFWDRERWEREIDWMALHGINMPLAVTGSEALWQRVLRRMGYPEERIGEFIAGPGFQAWWLMNNLEGWGGPVSQEHIDRQAELQQWILKRMREYGMEPVLPGYCGMVPHDADTVMGLHIADPGLWCGFTRPAILQPTDTAYTRMADIYYSELEKLYGKARYFSTDPFHEGGRTDGIDLRAAARAIMDAMRRHNPEAVWVAQGWQENPRTELLEATEPGEMLVLDLQAESRPMWCTRPGGFRGHDWVYCELLNFGGNQGLYGRINTLVDGYRRAIAESPELRGVGLTPEGIENNSVMYELLCELPWTDGGNIDIDRWLREYARTRYGGTPDPEAEEAWSILGRSVYACPEGASGQGARESLFCARPAHGLHDASTWANTTDYYDLADLERAAMLMSHASKRHADNPRFRYDFIDIVRQVIADRGRRALAQADSAYDRRDREAYRRASDEFMRLMLTQDSLLSLQPEFTLERYIDEARRMGQSEADKDLNEWNARVQITTWGPRQAADRGGLHDYSNREWSGLLRDFYYPRWQRWFAHRLEHWDDPEQPAIDFYPMEEEWTRRRGVSPAPAAHPDPSRYLRSALR